MNFEDAVFTEDLRISSGEKALDNLFSRYMELVFSPLFLKKINRLFNVTLVLKDFKQKSNVMCYTQGTKIYINRPLFASVEKNKEMDYIMHELFHVLSNTGRFPELDVVSRKLLNIVSKGVEKENITEFLTGKKQNIHSDWRGELINYLCNNSFKWELAMKEVKEAYRETLEESGLFNMKSAWWQKRFPLTKKEE